MSHFFASTCICFGIEHILQYRPFKNYLPVTSPQKPFCPFMDLMVTHFAWPCLLSSFWHIFCHAGPFYPPLGAHVCQLSKHSLSVIFSVKRLRVLPQDWHLQSANKFPLSSARCPNVHVPLRSQVTGNNVGGEFAIKTEVVWACWLPGDAGCSGVQGGQNGRNYIVQKHTHRYFSLAPLVIHGRLQSGTHGKLNQSLQCTPVNLHLLSVCDTLSFTREPEGK